MVLRRNIDRNGQTFSSEKEDAVGGTQRDPDA